MKILNLYAGVGGNRVRWENVEVTAVEYNADIAGIYKDRFPQDTVIVGDAHEFLIQHYQEFDFIWSSPPCPTHSQYRYNVGVLGKGYKPVYPDMTLYQEIIFLQHHFKGKWVVENTISYYDPLIPPIKLSRHYFWTNFSVSNIKIETTHIRSKNKIRDLEETFNLDLSRYHIPNKRQILRNCVNPELGLHILKASIS